MADADRALRRPETPDVEERTSAPAGVTVVARLSATESTLTVEIPLNVRLAALLRGLVRTAPRVVVVPSFTRELRPAASEGPSAVLLDAANQTIERDGIVVPLTAKERDLLAVLLEARGRVVTRAELLRRVWGYSADVRTRTLDTHISALRRKVERLPGPPPRIVAAHGLGYRWQD
jgi:DNA-binding response OmpR family regulator